MEDETSLSFSAETVLSLSDEETSFSLLEDGTPLSGETILSEETPLSEETILSEETTLLSPTEEETPLLSLTEEETTLPSFPEEETTRSLSEESVSNLSFKILKSCPDLVSLTMERVSFTVKFGVIKELLFLVPKLLFCAPDNFLSLEFSIV